jgi:hypothetical protein
MYALIAKFQIIGSTVLIQDEWSNNLVNFAASFAGLNLHIPFPWDKALQSVCFWRIDG